MYRITIELPLEHDDDRKTVGRCCMCRQDIYTGEYIYHDVMGYEYCSERCLKEAIKDDIDLMTFDEMETEFSVRRSVIGI